MSKEGSSTTKRSKKAEKALSGPKREYPVRERRNAPPRRYSPSKYAPQEWEIQAGEGIEIEKIPVIRAHIQETSRNHPFMKELHRLFFQRRNVKANEVKKNLLKFSGVVDIQDDEDREDFVENRLLGRGKNFLIDVHSFLGLKETGKSRKNMKKEELAEEIVTFLEKPGKKLCETKEFPWAAGGDKKKVKKKKTETKKRKREESESESEGESKRSSKKKKVEKEEKSDKEEEEKEEKKDKEKEESEEEKEESKSSKKRKRSSTSSSGSKKKAKGGKDDLKVGDYVVEYDKTGRAKCNNSKCKEKISVGDCRVGKTVKTPDGGSLMQKWYHGSCFKDAWSRMRSADKPESVDDFRGFADLKDKDKKMLEKVFK